MHFGPVRSEGRSAAAVITFLQHSKAVLQPRSGPGASHAAASATTGGLLDDLFSVCRCPWSRYVMLNFVSFLFEL